MCQRKRNSDADDPLYEAALRIVLEEREASIGLIQRRLRLGHSHVVKIFHRMETEGIIGAPPGNGDLRRILIPPFKKRLMLQGRLSTITGNT